MLGHCGEPVTQSSWSVEKSRAQVFSGGTITGVHKGQLLLVNSSRSEVIEADSYEEWTYNFGPSRFLYILTFKNGRLVKIDDDGYGY